MVPQLSSGWRHNYSTKTRQAGRANEQSMYSLGLSTTAAADTGREKIPQSGFFKVFFNSNA